MVEESVSRRRHAISHGWPCFCVAQGLSFLVKALRRPASRAARQPSFDRQASHFTVTTRGPFLQVSARAAHRWRHQRNLPGTGCSRRQSPYRPFSSSSFPLSPWSWPPSPHSDHVIGSRRRHRLPPSERRCSRAGCRTLGTVLRRIRFRIRSSFASLISTKYRDYLEEKVACRNRRRRRHRHDRPSGR